MSARRTGAIDEDAAADARSIRQADGLDTTILAFDLHNLAFAIDRPELTGLAAKGLEQAPSIEPAFAALAKSTDRDAVEIEEGKAPGKLLGLEEHDIGPLLLLKLLILH